MEAADPTPVARTRGPRAGDTDWRAEILLAAEIEFGANGYAATSVRAIANRAGVDAKLVHYYFGTKLELFRAALESAIDHLGVLQTLTAGGGGSGPGSGARYLALILRVLDDPRLGSGYLGLIRSIGTDKQSRDLFRSFVVGALVKRLSQVVAQDQVLLRASLVGSQVIGLITTRYIVKSEPLASMTPHQVAALVGPTLDHYLYEPL
ncbi:MAG: TetR family transcriptional regulator [Buchananella hordeovulneris]|nr:TetR family transcriptional regulator [Buchananella hordeovulneris]